MHLPCTGFSGYSQFMRSRPRKLNTPTALDDAIEQRVKELGYESFSDYVNGLIVYDLYTRKPHYLTGEISKLSRTEIDKLHDDLARDFAAGETIGGSWFEARHRKAVEDLAAGKEVPMSQTARKILEKIRK